MSSRARGDCFIGFLQGRALTELLIPDADAPKGARAPKPGEIFRNPTLASCLREIAAGGKDAFYEGRIALAITEVLQAVCRAGFESATPVNWSR